MAAKKSSYFLLTPASSTTSLHDISSISSIHRHEAVHKSTLTSNPSQSDEEDVCGEDNQTITSTTNVPQSKTTNRKRSATTRARRPSIIMTSSSSTTVTRRRPAPIATQQSNENRQELPPTAPSSVKQAKLSSCAASTAKSCSNLQKSKVLSDVAAVKTPPNEDKPGFCLNGLSLSQFYLRYAPKNSFGYKATTSSGLSSMSRSPMPELTWASSHALWATMKAKEESYMRDQFYLKRHNGKIY